jgi:hypothetical protein
MFTLLISFAALLAPGLAQAYPEMVRHHYVNCNSCHVSPAGGGLLNEYGRGMASEVLSTWNYENESLFLHGALKPEKMPKFLNVGGDLRVLQLHQETPTATEGSFMLMQSQVEAAVTSGIFTAVGAFGKPRGNNIEAEFPRYYLMASPLEGIQIRAGFFVPSFGLNIPHHTYPTRSPIGLGFTSRSTMQVDYSGEQWHAAFSASKSTLNFRTKDRERAASFQLERFINDSYRVGASTWNGESEAMTRWLNSVHGILGFSEKWYLLSELTWQSRKAKAAGSMREHGLFQFNRLGYEITKGVHLLAIEQYGQSNLKSAASQTASFGLGALWYPRPHFEFEFAFNKQKVARTSPVFEDFAYLMAHYYL